MKSLVIGAIFATLALVSAVKAHEGWHGGYWGHPHGGWHDGWGGLVPIPVPRPYYVEPEYVDPVVPACQNFWRHHRRVTICQE